MGLDLIVVGKAKTGCETEFRAILGKRTKREALSQQEIERFQQITTPAIETLGAPRVGTDAAANAWMINVQQKNGSQKSDTEIINQYRGYHVLSLLTDCDGAPQYSHGGLYDGVDETSFRGAFLNDCSSLIDKPTLERAWTDVMAPEDAISYGNLLLAAAEKEPQNPKTGFFAKVFGGKKQLTPVDEQRAILRSAGKWYIFWGKRGHHIEAFY